MNEATLEELKAAFDEIKATGSDGFEGMIGSLLSALTGIRFRLASSGRQHGIDGDQADFIPSVAFECKRYKGSLGSSDVLAKIADVSIKQPSLELWILAATCPVSSQVATDARRCAQTNGLAIEILDWTETGTPPLAILCAASPADTIRLLSKSAREGAKLHQLELALQAFRDSQDGQKELSELKARLCGPTVGLETCRVSLSRATKSGFANRAMARQYFGHPLAPIRADKPHKTLTRLQQQSSLAGMLQGPKGENGVALLGREGTGKTWLVANYWLSQKNPPLFVFLTPNDFSDVSSQDYLATALKKIEQINDPLGGEFDAKRWKRRLESPFLKSDPFRLIIVLDGINQYRGAKWVQVIEYFQVRLPKIHGRMIITSRPSFYKSEIMHRLDVPLQELHVSEWTHQERDELLTDAGVPTSQITSPIKKSLLNPRLLTVALETLTANDLCQLEDLTLEHLLFEHIWRTTSFDHPLESADEYLSRLYKVALNLPDGVIQYGRKSTLRVSVR